MPGALWNQPSPTHPPGHDHGDRLNQALESHQLVESEHLAGRHIQPVLGHNPCGRAYIRLHGVPGIPPHRPSFLMTLARGKAQVEGTRFGGNDPYSRQEGAGGFLSQALSLGGNFSNKPRGPDLPHQGAHYRFGAFENWKGLQNYLNLIHSFYR